MCTFLSGKLQNESQVKVPHRTKKIYSENWKREGMEGRLKRSEVLPVGLGWQTEELMDYKLPLVVNLTVFAFNMNFHQLFFFLHFNIRWFFTFGTRNWARFINLHDYS